MITKTRSHVIGDFSIPSDKFHKWMIKSYNTLYDGTGEGSKMRGWLNWPKEYYVSEEYRTLKSTAKEIREKSDIVIVIGIGGSYLTPQMIIHSEYGDYYNELASKNGNPRIYFAGRDLSPEHLKQIIEIVSGVDWSIIYISKSGGTIEPALSFHTLWELLEKQYGKEANQRVYAVTDSSKGILKGLANDGDWRSFIIPDDIGGRYSGFTACGLLPIAVAGINTDKLLKGAIDAVNDCYYNPSSFAGKYAEWRYYNYEERTNSVEVYAVNTPFLAYFSEWLKQLFGESEGKDGKGLFPASIIIPTDLHSLGQYLQEGLRDLICETFFDRDFKKNVKIPKVSLKDNLKIREGKKFTQAAAAAMDGAYNAHSEGGNACSYVRFGSTLEDMGYLMQTMFVACAVSAYMLGVNPFDQPGVESHKVKMQSSSKWDE